jgi:hypothetical protein
LPSNLKINNRQIQLQNVINHASTHPTISMLLWNISSNITCKKEIKGLC